MKLHSYIIKLIWILVPGMVIFGMIPVKAINFPEVNRAYNFNDGGTINEFSVTSPERKPNADITFIISLTTGGNPAGAVVSLSGQEPPFQEYSQVVSQSGIIVFTGLTEGNYLIEAVKSGFLSYSLTTDLISNNTYAIELQELRYKPFNLTVDNLTLIANWDEPKDVLVNEDFEGLDFPPAGWQALTQNNTGWYATAEGSTPRFPIPSHTRYAVTSDNSTNSNGCCDYLITPEMDLSNLPSYKLTFSSFFTGDYNQHAFVQISSDGGVTWNLINILYPNPLHWQELEIDLSPFSGPDGLKNVRVAFHADDYNDWASGWAIDNVKISSANIPLQGYGLFLDGVLIDNTNGTNYTYTGLNYGQEYLAGVAASYSSGFSEIDTCHFTSAYLCPPRNLQGIMPALTDYVHLWWEQPQIGDTAGNDIQGLLGYNVFRNNSLIAFTEQPVTEYFDLNLEPGTYSYHITAVYDLSFYGFPGANGESMIEGPVVLTYLWSNQLPFNENFNTGLFETNQWTVEGANWRIAGQVGNQAPSAEFYRNPVAANYSYSLTSNLMNGAGYIDGSIMFDFDIKHTLVDSTKAGFLAVEVFNGDSWNKVTEFVNSVNLGWISKSIDITGHAKGNLFRVRFRAYGDNTLDITNWLVDNIHLYRKCAEPKNLIVSIAFPSLNSALLTWEAPSGGGTVNSVWLGWDNGTNDDAIGLTGGGTFSVAVKFTPAQLGQYAGNSLTRLRFFPYAAGTFDLKVWTGANASTLVVTQPVASVVVGEWNEVALTASVPVTGDQELWFGYTVTHATNDFPAGVDAGPAVAGFGDMISLDGSVWESMATAYALNFNWNMNGYVESVDGVTTLLPITDNAVYGPVSQLVRGFLPMSPYATLANTTAKAGRALVGYNVWRSNGFDPEVIISTTTETTFIDRIMPNFMNCYFVTALYEDCESGATNESCVWVGIDKLKIPEDLVLIYPNPSNSFVNIEFARNIGQIIIYNLFGQVVYQQVVTGSRVVQINVKDYELGVYQVKLIDCDGEIHTGKLIITQ